LLKRGEEFYEEKKITLADLKKCKELFRPTTEFSKKTIYELLFQKDQLRIKDGDFTESP